MEIDIYNLLYDNHILLLFIVIGLGYLLGNVKLFGTPMGPTIGVLAAGLFFGHIGMSVAGSVSTFGFTLFIFSIGIEAGPSFFSAFREDGPKYIILALIVATTAFVLALMLSKFFGFANGFDAGLLAGGMTSTPTLAGAQDAVHSGLAALGAGQTAEQLLENLSVGYALTYLIGTITVILLVRYLPKLKNMNLEAMARTYAKEKGLLRDKRSREATADTLPVIRAYRVKAEHVGKSLAQRRAEIGLAGSALRVRRGDEILEASPDLRIEDGDVISVIANVSAHQWAQENLGAEVLDAELLNYEIDAHEVVVLTKYAVGKSLKELDIVGNYACWPTQLIRAGVQLPVTDEAVLLKGDRLHVVGEGERLRRLAEQVGHIEEEVEATDLVTFSFGIAMGLLLGMIVVKVGGLSIGLGSAGGLLIAGIVIGYLSSLNPTFGRVPSAARYLLKEFGLMLMMAAIGINAGAGIVEGLLNVGPAIIASALVVALLPFAVGYVVGRRVLKLNPALLLGSLTGSMTSTPALSVVTAAAKSNVPAIGYAGTYTFANVLLTFAGTYMMTL